MKNIKIAGFPYELPPFAYKCSIKSFGENCSDSLGIITDIFHLIFDSKNVEFIPASHLNGSLTPYPKDPRFTTLESLIFTGQVDTAMYIAQVDTLKTARLVHSWPIYDVQHYFVLKKPQQTVFTMAATIFSVFPLWLWLLLLSSLGILVALLFMGEHFYYKRQKSFSLWRHLRMIIPNQVDPILEFESKGTKLLFIFTGIFLGIFILSLYQSLLLAHLLLPQEQKLFSKLDELIPLIENNELTVVSEAAQLLTYKIRLRETKYFSQLADATKFNPLKQANTTKEIINLINDGKHVYYSLNEMRAYSIIFASKNCDLQSFADDEMGTFSAAIYFRPNSSLIPAVNLEIMKKREQFDIVLMKYKQKMKLECGSVSDNIGQPLAIRSLLGSIILWVVGICFATSLFILEITSSLSRMKTVLNRNKVVVYRKGVFLKASKNEKETKQEFKERLHEALDKLVAPKLLGLENKFAWHSQEEETLY